MEGGAGDGRWGDVWLLRLCRLGVCCDSAVGMGEDKGNQGFTFRMESLSDSTSISPDIPEPSENPSSTETNC